MGTVKDSSNSGHLGSLIPETFLVSYCVALAVPLCHEDPILGQGSTCLCLCIDSFVTCNIVQSFDVIEDLIVIFIHVSVPSYVHM